jgi:hypothetical protein
MTKIWLSLLVLLIGLVTITEADIYPMLDIKPLILGTNQAQSGITMKSKAQLVNEVNQTVFGIHKLEMSQRKTGLQGYKVYTSAESEQLIGRYQKLTTLLHYLNWGNFKSERNQWEGYSLSLVDNISYERGQILQVMSELMQSKVPPAFVAGLKIYLLPYAIPGVSGLGGPGYILLSAQTAKANLIPNQLPVTLYHEIGHHVNFTFMPKGTPQGEERWTKFLQIRGGNWHGPGVVNTTAWGESSEETFAEDFRMLFGKAQPYFGDLALGDPRVNLVKAKNEKRFMINLALSMLKFKQKDQSPWIPERGLLYFWQRQGEFLIGAWLFLGVGILAVNYLRNTSTIHEGKYLKT